jgi:hypothetical protein
MFKKNFKKKYRQYSEVLAQLKNIKSPEIGICFFVTLLFFTTGLNVLINAIDFYSQ